MRANKLAEHHYQEENYELKECIEGLKIYFDYANINVSSFIKNHGMKKYKKLDKSIQYMYKNFPDEK
jgi:hypothetical protein